MADQVTDERLLERAASGDGTAFQILYERYRDGIFRFAYRLIGSIEAAEDVTHDCFLSLIKEPGRYDPGRASLRTYLYAAARNLALLRKIALNLIGRDRSCTASVRARRKRAAWNDGYMLKLLADRRSDPR